MAVKIREVRGVWRVVVDWKGRRVSRNVGRGTAGQKAAAQASQQIAARLALGDLRVLDAPAASAPAVPVPVMPTFRQYAEAWLTTEAALRCKASTCRTYGQTLTRLWYPLLGDRPVSEITRAQVLEALVTLKPKLSAGTIKHSGLVVLRAVLSTAETAGLIARNPAAKLGRYVRSDVPERERVDPFTRDELQALLHAAEATLPEWAPFVLCLVRTGLRISEALALQPDDLDFAQRTIWVRRNGYRRRVTTPKSNRTRKVDMSQQLTRTLQGWLSLRQAEAIVSGATPSPWLFPGPQGGLLDPDWFAARVWRPLQARAGLRYRTPHQARHTFATLLLQQGESLDYVKVQLGHSSIRVTADTYVHWLPGSNRGAVDRLDAPAPAPIRNPRATESRSDAQPRELSDGPGNVPQDQAGQTPRGRVADVRSSRETPDEPDLEAGRFHAGRHAWRSFGDGQPPGRPPDTGHCPFPGHRPSLRQGPRLSPPWVSPARGGHARDRY
jgi:integrase